MGAETRRPLVSVVVPCRNEEAFIGDCLTSIVAAEYPKESLEVLVVDGASEDGTRRIAEEYARRYPFIRILSNPRRYTPMALNIGIRASRGRFIMWMGAHSRYPPDYISQCVTHLEASGADNVGGNMVTVPRDDTPMGRAIVTCLSHPLGVGNSHFRIHSQQQRWVDTVFGGAYRREVFVDVGLFNECLERGQDMEFNLRLKREGKRTLLVPSIRAYYYARTSLKTFWAHNWANGVWAIKPFLYSAGAPVTLRHLVPMGFVTTLLALAAAGLVWRTAWLGLAGLVGVYLLAGVGAGLGTAVTRRDARYAWLLPLTFANLHLAYGLGSLAGLLAILPRWLTGGRRVPPLERLPGEG